MNRTRKLVNTAVLTSLAVVLAILVNFPIFPSASYLRYDLGDVAVLIASFAFGPIAGLASSAMTAILQALVTGQGGWVGALMHFISTGALSVTAGLVYSRRHDKVGAITGLVAGTFALVVVMLLAWITIVPAFYGMPLKTQVLPILLPVVVPFNVVKGLISGVITFILYRRIRFLLKR